MTPVEDWGTPPVAKPIFYSISKERDQTDHEQFIQQTRIYKTSDSKSRQNDINNSILQ